MTDGRIAVDVAPLGRRWRRSVRVVPARSRSKSGIGRYARQRLFQFVIVIWGASTVMFFAFRIVADPVRTMLPVGTPTATIEAVESDLGLDEPLLVQYRDFLGDTVRGDFGNSLWLGEDAFEATVARVPMTAVLVVSSLLIGCSLGIALGIAASLRPGSIVDLLVNIVTYLTISLPYYWVGMLFVLLFAVELGWFPTSGSGGIEYAVLPIATLSLVPLGRTAQLVRASMIEESQKQYVAMARGKGLSSFATAFRHQLRNVSPAILTLAFYDLGHLFVGDAVVVETIFAWPGLGRLAVGALSRGDVFLVQAVVFVAAVLIATSNLVADLLGLKLDPRARDALRR